MRVAVMQPYLLPYIGYWQLMAAVDVFVAYDDVNYIKGGWINRNFVLGSHGEKQRITLSLQGASPNRLINEVQLGGNNGKLLRTIQNVYARAPQYAQVYPLVERVLMQDEKNLARFLYFGMESVSEFLCMKTQLLTSSELPKDNSLRGQEKILNICEELKATHYINLPGGRSLYDSRSFEDRGIKLSFVEPRKIQYQQFGAHFTPFLSIIDVMMFNDAEQCARLLQEYDLD